MNNYAVVLNMDSNGLGVTRSLGRLGIPVCGVDHENNKVGLYSKYCTQKTLVPDPAREPEACRDALIRLGKNYESRPVLLPTSDAYVILVSRYEIDLSKYFSFNIPDHSILESVVDKSKQYTWAQQLGIPIPKTFYPASEDDLENQKKDFQYPLLIKGISSHQWQAAFTVKGFVSRNYEELTDHFRKALERNIPVVLQEIIQGPNKNHFKVCAYYRKDGRLLALFSTQKTRQYPVDFGVGSYMTSGYYPELISLGRKFFEGMRYTGVGSIEFKMDDRDGSFKLIELNPRLWQQNIQATTAGVNFALINYRDCCGEDFPSQLEFASNVIWLDAIQDFQSFLANRKNGDITFLRWVVSLLKADCFGYFAWDDLRPGWRNSEYGSKFLKFPLKVFGK